MATTRKAVIITPSVDGAWVEDVLGTFDYEADAAHYTVMMLTEDELATLRAAGRGYEIDWAEPGRYVDDTEGAVIVAEDGSLTVEGV
jgi:hypothetical protein